MLTEKLQDSTRRALTCLLVSVFLFAGCSSEDADTADFGKPEMKGVAGKETIPAPDKMELSKAKSTPAEQSSATVQATSQQAASQASPPEAKAASGADMIGARIYKQACAACHKMGVAGAPKLGDTEKWKERMAKGKDTLFTHVKKGFNAMPPKGGCVQCSDEELRIAIDYMLNKSL